MKKALLFTAITVLSLNAFALTETSKCRKQVRYQLRTVQSDYPVEIGKGLELPAGEKYVVNTQRVVGPFEEDAILYGYSGSYHSGSFGELAVVDPQTCKIERTIEIYAE